MIYPDVFPGDLHSPEGKVFTALKRISHHYEIFHSRKFTALTRQEKPQYECDFIITDGTFLLDLEVKGGTIRFEGSRNHWTQNGHHLDNPVNQAISNTSSLLKRFRELANTMPFDWALCFPESSKPSDQFLPTEVTATKIIDQNELIHIESKIRDIINDLKDRYGHRTLHKNDREYTRFIKSFTRGFNFIQSLKSKIEIQNNQFIKLTEQQLSIIKGLMDNTKILVKGVAGSGKTLIGQYLAEEAEDEGKVVLFLCFNRILANRIKSRLHWDDPRCIIETFHQYAENRISEADNSWIGQQQKNNEFFNDIVPLKFLEIQENHPKKYDLIIIDEGQDFTEYWMEVILNELDEDGKMIIFMDSEQNIFKREIPNQFKNFATYNLTENCRNTKKITQFINHKLGKRIINKADVPEGDEVIEWRFTSAQNLLKSVGKELNRLIDDEGLNTDQIIILVDKPLEHSMLNQFERIGKFNLKELGKEAKFEQNTIHYSNAHRFKGLESDIVMVLYEQPSDLQNDWSKNKYYVKASRARHRLYIIELIDK